MVASHDLAVDADIGDIHEARMLEAVGLFRDIKQSHIQRAEPFGEGHVLIVVEWLIAPYQDGVFVHRLLDLCRCLRIDRLPQVEAGRLGGEIFCHGCDFKLHAISIGLGFLLSYPYITNTGTAEA